MVLLEDFKTALDARGASKARKQDCLRVLHQLEAFIGPKLLCDEP